jgi:hypothetical protein
MAIMRNPVAVAVARRAGQHSRVEQLRVAAYEPDPLDDIGRLEVDDLHATPGLGYQGAVSSSSSFSMDG